MWNDAASANKPVVYPVHRHGAGPIVNSHLALKSYWAIFINRNKNCSIMEPLVIALRMYPRELIQILKFMCVKMFIQHYL